MAAELHRDGILANADNGARLIAYGSRSPETGHDAEKLGAPCLAIDNLLEHPEIDVICLCTPSGCHGREALAAAEAGKHLIVEKPMALTLADADAMIEAFDSKGLQLGVALQRRADPMFQRIAEAVAAGDLGELVQGMVTIPYNRNDAYYDLADWRGTWAQDGGGVLMNQGFHLVDLLIWFMGDPVEVTARAATLKRSVEVEDTLVATLRFANGALATITATTLGNPRLSAPGRVVRDSRRHTG